jgi:hypothetical protein
VRDIVPAPHDVEDTAGASVLDDVCVIITYDTRTPSLIVSADYPSNHAPPPLPYPSTPHRLPVPEPRCSAQNGAGFRRRARAIFSDRAARIRRAEGVRQSGYLGSAAVPGSARSNLHGRYESHGLARADTSGRVCARRAGRVGANRERPRERHAPGGFVGFRSPRELFQVPEVPEPAETP